MRRVLLLHWFASPSIIWLANYVKIFCERYVFEDIKVCIGQRNLHSRNTLQYGTHSITSCIIIFAVSPTIRSHTACNSESDVNWTADKFTMPIITQKLILLTDTLPVSCLFKMFMSIIIILPKVTDYGRFSGKINYLGCNNKLLKLPTFITWPPTF
jgi:hypothetical protein